MMAPSSMKRNMSDLTFSSTPAEMYESLESTTSSEEESEFSESEEICK